jgi:hypothetical protein
MFGDRTLRVRKQRTGSGRRSRCVVGIELLEPRELLALQLEFNYSLDNSGFMTPARRALFESTLDAIAGRLNNSLAAVSSLTITGFPTPSGPKTITASVPANTLEVYVFGGSLSGSTAGEGGSAAANRGEPSNVYAPAVAYIEFDDDGSTPWYFGASTTGGVGLSGNATSLNGTNEDFVSVATHEFLHGLGISASDPVFESHVSNGYFTGSNAEAAHEGIPFQLSSDGSHIAAPVSVMNPSLTEGVRYSMNALEWGILKDIGWSVASESGFYQDWDLFTGGSSGSDVVHVFPSRGVYLMEVDALSGDNLSLTTADGTAANLQGVSSYLKLFDSNGNLVAASGPTGGSNKAVLNWHFNTGGRFFVGASTAAQSGFTFTSAPTSDPSGQGFVLNANLDGTVDNLPQNIVSATNPFTIGASSYSSTGFVTDVSSNVYSIITVPGHVYNVATFLPSAGGFAGPAIITIYDRSGNEIAGMTAPPADSDVGGDYGLTSFTAATAGPYYVFIQPYIGSSHVAPDQGSLSVGWGVISSSGEFTANGDRNSGSDYAISITDATLAGSNSPGSGNGGSGSGPSGQAPIFEGEKRVVVRIGRKKITTYELIFSTALNTSLSQSLNPYQVFQVKKLSKHRTKHVAVRVRSATVGASATTVTLQLGNFAKSSPLIVEVSGLAGSNGTVIAPFATSL